MARQNTAPRYRVVLQPALPALADYEGSDYRRDYWENTGREYEDQVERMALARLLPQQGLRLVDIGAGYGRLATAYGDYGQVILVDYSRSLLTEARQRLGGGRYVYVAADLYRLPLATNSVDTLMMVRVLHHLADVPRALRQVSRVIRPRGCFVLEYANECHLKNRLCNLAGGGPNLSDCEPHQIGSLYYRFHPSWVGERLLEANLVPQERLSVSLLRSQLLKRCLPPRVLSTIDGLQQRLAAPLALGPSMLVRSEADKPGECSIVDGLFRCPSCGYEPLSQEPEGAHCPGCRTLWPIVDGIHVFK